MDIETDDDDLCPGSGTFIPDDTEPLNETCLHCGYLVPIDPGGYLIDHTAPRNQTVAQQDDVEPWRDDARLTGCYCADERVPCEYNQGYETGYDSAWRNQTVAESDTP